MKHYLIIFYLFLGPLSFASGVPENSSPRLVAHLLDYLSKDYAGAVHNGKVISQSEYQEQVEFATSALSMSKEIDVLKKDAEIITGLSTLKRLIDEKAPESTVSELASSLKLKVLTVAKIEQTPQRWPSLSHGKELFQRNCISCHGNSGGGDGPAGVNLDPKPANFLSEDFGKEITPFRAFNTIRVGIPGTGMTAWSSFADQDVWDLSFYVVSLHLVKDKNTTPIRVSTSDLKLAATFSDVQITQSLSGDENEKRLKLIALRLYSSDDSSSNSKGSGERAVQAEKTPNSLNIARIKLLEAETAYKNGDTKLARAKALLAYLEGIEPVEPRLRASDAGFVTRLEVQMAQVRANIESKNPPQELASSIQAANQLIDEADKKLNDSATSPWVTFLITVGILLREGFEAVLILIALLAVVRASDSKRAARWIHSGWIAALGTGFAAWFFSGWLMNFSGAKREMLEAVTSLLAVIVLLYIGFWLHSKTEITKWNSFIHGQVKSALDGGNLVGLALISFMAVFREAFETVLFMRAITLEGGPAGTQAMVLGVIISLGMIFLLTWILLRFSTRIPVRKIFGISSGLMAVLAVILTGKGLHALQETGSISVTAFLREFQFDLVGFYPTLETALSQLGVVIVIFGVWFYGKIAYSKKMET